jgi:uncharacterized membrane protein (UPF0136 family)
MTIQILAAILYGSLAIAGGAMGYVKARSKPSLISGLASGILLLVAAAMQWQGLAFGLLLAQVVTAALVLVFALRLFKTRKFMPAGLMLVAGIAAFSILIAA